MADASQALAEFVDDYGTGILTLRLFLAATALFCFDYILTFSREVQRIWKLRFTTSAMLFYCVRYSALFNTIFVVLEQTQWNGISDMSCAVLLRTQMALNIVLLLSASVFSALRAYALSGQNKSILAILLILGFLNPAITLYTFVQSDVFYISWPLQACGFSSVIDRSVFERCIIVARASSVLTDVLVLAVTVSKTRPLRTEAPPISFTSSVADILMRDGALYFALLLVANSVALGLVRTFSLIQPMSMWIAIVTSIMTSRFILDLHEAADPRAGRDLSSVELDTLSTTMFPPPVGAPRGRQPPFDSVFGASTIASMWFCDDDEDTLDDSWEGKSEVDGMSHDQRSDCVEDGRRRSRNSVASNRPRSGADSPSFILMH